MSKRTEIADQYTAHVRNGEVDKVLALLADNVTMMVPRFGQVTGKAAVEQGLRMMQESGRGRRVRWSPAVEEGDKVRVQGKGARGVGALIAKVMGMPSGVKMLFGFNAEDKIDRIDIVMG